MVGGENSYDLGGYSNSGLERFLPVRSVPSLFEGGKTLAIVLDISFSLLTARTRDGTTLLDYEKALAVELLKSPDLQDYKVGLIVFGTRALIMFSIPCLYLAPGRLCQRGLWPWVRRALRTATWIEDWSWPGICF